MCFSLHGCLAMFSFGNVMGKKVKILDDFALFLLSPAGSFSSFAGLRKLLVEARKPTHRGMLLGPYGAHSDSLMLETLLILSDIFPG